MLDVPITHFFDEPASPVSLEQISLMAARIQSACNPHNE